MLRNTKRRSAEQSLLFLHLLLPEEIVEDILSRLPVKSLSRFKCVSKSWLFLIESDRFIKTHLQNSTKNMKLAHHRVIFNANRGVMNGFSLQSLLNSVSREGSSSIDDPTKINEPPKTGILVGCCNGVLCVYDQSGGRFLLWNPATRISIKIPKILRGVRKYGFGWDKSSGSYKVFAVVGSNYCFFGTGKVYSSETNLWKSIGRGSRSFSSPIGVFVGGKLNWAIFYSKHRDYYIECFDLGSEEFGRIELPPFKFNSNSKSVLGEIGGCLSILFDFAYKKSVDVWVMKEYGVKESWLKLLSLPFAAVTVCDCRIYEFTPLFGGEGPNGEIFLMFGHTFLVYSPKDDVFSTSKNFESFFGARVYVESLVSPQRILFGHYDTSPVRQRHAPRWHEDYVAARNLDGTKIT